MVQAAWRLTDAVDGFLAGHRVLICDRDAKWTDGFRRIVQDAGVKIVRTPVQAPNANAYAERFVRSIREECLGRRVPRMPNREGRQYCGRDEGGPLGVGVQDQAPNPLTLRWSRATVVNGEAKGALERVRYGSGRRTRVNR
jgi:hypothetical protein